MKKNVILFVLLLFTIICNVHATDLSITWGQKEKFSNGNDGYITAFVGKSSKYVYAYYSNGGIGNSSTPDNYSKLIAFDSQTLQRAFEVPLKGYDANKATKSLDLITYERTVVLDDVIYVFWIGENNRTKQLFMSSYDLELNPIAPLKKIFEAEGQKGDDISPELVIKSNKSGHILIGAEKGTKENVNLKFSYRVVDSKLNFVSSKEIELPISFDLKWWESKHGLSSRYELLDDNNLYITSFISVDNSANKKSKFIEPQSYTMLSVVPILTGEMKVFPFKFSGKYLHNITFRSDAKTIKVYGTYTELNDIAESKTGEGIFTCSIDSKSLTVSETAHFSPITKIQDASLTTKTNAFILNSFEIMDIQKYENNSLIFLCDRARYTQLSNYTPNIDYCINANFYCLSLSDKGDFNWVTLCDRKITYTQLNFTSSSTFGINDIRVVKNGDNFLVIYDSGTYIDPKGKTRTKTTNEFYTYEDYLILDPKTGKYKQSQTLINQPTVKNKNRKHFSSAHTYLLDDQLYFFTKEVKMKTFFSWTSWLMLMIPYNIEGSYTGTGTVGKINLIK